MSETATSPSIAVATIAAKPMLPSARVVATSARRHHPDWPVFVLVADEIDGWFPPERERGTVVRLDDLRHGGLRDLAFRYEQQPFSYALTPTLIRHVLDRGFRRVLFIKQESLVVGALDSVVQALDDAPIVLTPHLLAPLEGDEAADRELNILQSGVFNGGIVAVADSRTTRDFLDWWEDRLRTDCRLDVANGLHYEQRWLDLAPSLFGEVAALRDPGVNVGHWNLPERHVEVRTDRILVDGAPAGLVRFSGFDAHAPTVVTRYNRRLDLDAIGGAADVFAIYERSLREAGYELARSWPYAYATFDNGVPIPAVARSLYAEIGPDVARFGDPFRTTEEPSYFGWLTGVDGRQALWDSIHRSRPDLQTAFPDPWGHDAPGFAAWITRNGGREHAVARPFLPTTT